MSGLTVHFERIEFEPGGVRGRELPLLVYRIADGETVAIMEEWVEAVNATGKMFTDCSPRPGDDCRRWPWKRASLHALYVPVRVEEEER